MSTTKAAFPTPGSSLGLRVSDDLSIHEKILDGFSLDTLKRFEKASRLPGAVILDVIELPARTLARRKETGKLHKDESERLFRLARVFELAVELFNGDCDAAVRWLRTPRPVLGGATPLELARTGVGARRVEGLIWQLENGVIV